MAAPVLLVLVGSLIVVQVLGGDALERLNVKAKLGGG